MEIPMKKESLFQLHTMPPFLFAGWYRPDNEIEITASMFQIFHLYLIIFRSHALL